MSNSSSLHDDFTVQRIIQRIIGRLVLCIFLAGVFPIASIAQDSTIEINSFRNFRYIDSFVKYEITEPGVIADQQIPAKLKFNSFLPAEVAKNTPEEWIEKELFLKFTLANDSDHPRTISFYPGTYFTAVKIFKANADSVASDLRVLKDSVPPDKNIEGYHLITMEPWEKSVFFARLRFFESFAQYSATHHP